MQADTIVPELGNPLAFDRYAYVKNNPIINIDPYGHNGIEFCPGKNDGYAIIAIGSIWSLFISIAQRDGLSEKIEDAITNFPIRLPEIQPLTFPIQSPIDERGGLISGVPVSIENESYGIFSFPLVESLATITWFPYWEWEMGSNFLWESQEAARMFGEGGSQFTHKTLWEGKEGMLHAENPNPGQRPGQIHFQKGKWKFLYNPETNSFGPDISTGSPAPRWLNDMLEDDRFFGAVQKGLRFLGE